MDPKEMKWEGVDWIHLTHKWNIVELLWTR
jgi:hypothetical protein